MDAVRLVRCLPVSVLLGLGCGLGEPDRNPFLADPVKQTKLYQDSQAALEQPIARPQSPQVPPEPPIVIGNPALNGPSSSTTQTITQASGVTAPPQPQGGTPQAKIVAIIGADGIVTDDEVWMRVRQRSEEFKKLKGTDRSNKEKEVYNEALRMLIERELIIADFTQKIRKNKPQVLDELKAEAKAQGAKAVKTLITELRTQNNIATDAEVIEIMNKLPGMSIPLIQRSHERQAIVDIYVQQFIKDKGKQVSLADVQRYYNDNPKLFRVEDRVKWLDLFVSFSRFQTTEQAQEYAAALQKQLLGGADFVQVVKQYGHGDSVLRQGDGIGSKRGEIQPAELEEIVFSLKPGETSSLIPTQNGLHIIKVLERDVAGIRPLDEKTQTQIKNKLLSDMREAELKKLIEELWRKITVRIIE